MDKKSQLRNNKFGLESGIKSNGKTEGLFRTHSIGNSGLEELLSYDRYGTKGSHSTLVMQPANISSSTQHNAPRRRDATSPWYTKAAEWAPQFAFRTILHKGRFGDWFQHLAVTDCDPFHHPARAPAVATETPDSIATKQCSLSPQPMRRSVSEISQNLRKISG